LLISLSITAFVVLIGDNDLDNFQNLSLIFAIASLTVGVFNVFIILSERGHITAHAAKFPFVTSHSLIT